MHSQGNDPIQGEWHDSGRVCGTDGSRDLFGGDREHPEGVPGPPQRCADSAAGRANEDGNHFSALAFFFFMVS